jgi:uncharacterized membrane protein
VNSKNRSNKENFPATNPSLILASLLLLLRLMQPGGWYYWFFIMNGIFAWIPFILSDIVYRKYLDSKRLNLWDAGILVVVVLFLPNTFYMITDFVHLDSGQSMIVWLDVLMTGAFAWLGMLYGFLTLRKLHLMAREFYGRTIGWVTVGGLLILSSIGIYLGRVARFYSWDIALHPIRFTSYILSGIGNTGNYVAFVEFTTGFVLFLGVIYLTFYAVKITTK